MLYYIWKDFGVALQLKSISKVILAGALMYLASLFFPTGQFIFILWSIILFAIYLLLLYITKEITPKDLFFLKKMLLKNK
jgi:hypothetical protein